MGTVSQQDVRPRPGPLPGRRPAPWRIDDPPGAPPERTSAPLACLVRRAYLLPVVVLTVVGCVTNGGAYPDGTVPARRAARGEHGVGVFLGGSSLRAHESWLGRPVTHVGAYVSQQSWDAFDLTGFGQWAGSGKQLVVGVPLLVRSQPGSLAAGAAGAYDRHFRALAQRLVEDGHGTAVLRLGWDFNGEWSLWRANRDPRAFVAYWRRVVTVMRAVPGAAGLRFDWSAAHGPRSVPVEAYPGDTYVDVIGMDVFDRSYGDRFRDPAARWEDYVHRPYGLDWLRDFAAAHGKPLSFPEWGVTHQHAAGVPADNPTFIRGMAEFIRTNDVDYQLYYDVVAHDGDFRIRSFPRSAAAYRSEF